MPRFSIVIPFYDGLDNIKECVDSVLVQGFDDIEVIIVDDRDSLSTGDALDSLFFGEPKVHIIHRPCNGGTLNARRDGVLVSTGKFVLLLDQDDCLADGCLNGVCDEMRKQPVDILHFGAKVIAETNEAESAAAGMENFLSPPERELQGDEILARQFAFDGGFDWHVHHKAYRGDFARACWEMAGETKLTLSDDLYLSFILCAHARSYRAIKKHWYLYHLGRGETLGGRFDLASLRRVSELDAKALKLLRAFVALPDEAARRSDWPDRLTDVRDHLIEHVTNEMADNLPFSKREQAIRIISESWTADDYAGELWRFARDRAYGLFDSRSYPTKDDQLYTLVEEARAADALVSGEGSPRYREMKEATLRHLNDLETIGSPAQKFTRRIGRLIGRK